MQCLQGRVAYGSSGLALDPIGLNPLGLVAFLMA